MIIRKEDRKMDWRTGLPTVDTNPAVSNVPEVPIKESPPKEPVDSWKDHHCNRILNSKIVKNCSYVTLNPGDFFPDEDFPADLISLLTSHHQISSFDAEFAIYVHISNKPDKTLKNLYSP